MGDLKSRKKTGGRLTSFIEGRNWFVSAGLVVFIYGVVWYYIRTYSAAGGLLEDVSPLTLLLQNVIHVLPLLALALIVMGVLDKRRREDEDRERKRKRYEARMEISRLKRETGERGPGPGS